MYIINNNISSPNIQDKTLGNIENNISENLISLPELLAPNSEIEQLREKCPLPILMKKMGFENHIKKSCSSPFRDDQKPSWGIYQRDNRCYWKDLGNDDRGDEITFIARAKNLKENENFREIINLWKAYAAKCSDVEYVEYLKELPVIEPQQKPDKSGFGPGNDQQLERLCKLRDIDARGILLAQMSGLLIFGRFSIYEVYGVTDSTGNIVEVRRLDGQLFPAYKQLPERKSHALKGSHKNWPVGIKEVGEKPMVLLVEGLPDLLSAFEVIVTEDAMGRVAPVAMLSANSLISEEALPLFKGKHVRIVPHLDEAGRDGATKWKDALIKAGASKVDFFLVSDERDANQVKDLNEYLPYHREKMANGSEKGGILL